MTNVLLICHFQYMTMLHDKLRWIMTKEMTNYEFIICRFISHSEIKFKKQN